MQVGGHGHRITSAELRRAMQGISILAAPAPQLCARVHLPYSADRGVQRAARDRAAPRALAFAVARPHGG